MPRTDILLSESFDLIDTGEEWLEGDSDQQHVELLTLLDKGEVKEFPFIGFGIQRRMKGVADKNRFKREFKVELENDGYANPELIVNDDLSQFKVQI